MTPNPNPGAATPRPEGPRPAPKALASDRLETAACIDMRTGEPVVALTAITDGKEDRLVVLTPLEAAHIAAHLARCAEVASEKLVRDSADRFEQMMSDPHRPSEGEGPKVRVTDRVATSLAACLYNPGEAPPPRPAPSAVAPTWASREARAELLRDFRDGLALALVITAFLVCLFLLH